MSNSGSDDESKDLAEGQLEKAHAQDIRLMLEEEKMPPNFGRTILSLMGQGRDDEGKPKFPQVLDIQNKFCREYKIAKSDVGKLADPTCMSEERSKFVKKFLLRFNTTNLRLKSLSIAACYMFKVAFPRINNLNPTNVINI